VDRQRASSAVNTGLLLAAIAVGVFGLTFFAAIIYIG
jgi:hypothetical protein